MIVNDDYIKQRIIFAIFWGADYTSKYCLLSIQLTSACIYTPQHISFGCFVCVCCLFRIFCLTLYDQGELLILSHSEISLKKQFNSVATLLCVGDFSQKNVLHRVAKNNFD